MRKFIGKSNERILCQLSKSEILRLYSIVHVAMETTKTSHFTCRSKSFISIFFTCQVSACELPPFSCYDLTNDIYSQTAKIVFSHLNAAGKKALLAGYLIPFLQPQKPCNKETIPKSVGMKELKAMNMLKQCRDNFHFEGKY